MKNLSLLLLFVLVGCSSGAMTSPSLQSGQLYDGPPPANPAPIGGTCEWRDLQVEQYLALSCGSALAGCLGPHLLSNGRYVFIEDRPTATKPYTVTDYPAPWCTHAAS